MFQEMRNLRRSMFTEERDYRITVGGSIAFAEFDSPSRNNICADTPVMIAQLHNHNSFACPRQRSNSIRAFYISILPKLAYARYLLAERTPVLSLSAPSYRG